MHDGLVCSLAGQTLSGEGESLVGGGRESGRGGESLVGGGGGGGERVW